jgi:hypothetical protein
MGNARSLRAYGILQQMWRTVGRQSTLLREMRKRCDGDGGSAGGGAGSSARPKRTGRRAGGVSEHTASGPTASAARRVSGRAAHGRAVPIPSRSGATAGHDGGDVPGIPWRSAADVLHTDGFNASERAVGSARGAAVADKEPGLDGKPGGVQLRSVVQRGVQTARDRCGGGVLHGGRAEDHARPRSGGDRVGRSHGCSSACWQAS